LCGINHRQLRGPQAGWKQASTIGGLITGLAHQVKGKSDQEIENVIARVTERLRRAKQQKA
jgi:hypothetical protein